MIIGNKDRWWNRRVPILRISVTVATIFVGLFVWLVYGDLIGTVAWDVRHQRTATFRGQTLQIPWFWRQEEWANHNYFDLTRTSHDVGFVARATVTYEDSVPADIQRKVDNANKLDERLSQATGGFYGDYSGDDFSRMHFVCRELDLKWSPLLMVDCFSRDGRWSVNLLGTQRSHSDFNMILRGVAAMGNPSK